MKPKLVALAGPVRGKTYPLNEARSELGRVASCRISVPDQAVSRRHCVLENENERITLHDLDSRNGTRINGMPVITRTLEDGDIIEVGDSQFLFLCDDSRSASPSPSITIKEFPLKAANTVKLSARAAVQPELGAPDLTGAQASRKAHDLDVLLRINDALNQVRELEPLERQLLATIFEVIPATRGAILLSGGPAGGWESSFGSRPGERRECPVDVSQAVLNQVMGEGVGILSTDARVDPALRESESLFKAHVTALLCVPLMVFDRLIGVIYLDTSDRARHFDRDHLALLLGIARVAAPALDNVRRLACLEAEKNRLIDEIRVQHNMVGESERIRQVERFIAKVAAADSTVLIRGESGTGKELVARAIHYISRRKSGAFVAINCAAIPENLLETELFGHERGAFTGAVGLKKGKLEMANGGTLFLDEISELALPLQAKLLRVLQEREFERVGATTPVKVDLRVVAATNRNLEDLIRAGAFRQDLFFRLNVVSVTLPTLRERREDIPLLAHYFIARLSRQCGRRVRSLSSEAKACLMRYDWPGNVRELENAIERAIVLGSGDVIEVEDLPESLLEFQPALGEARTRFHEALQLTKRQLILEAMEQAGGVYTEAAKRLGLHPNYLHRLIRNLNLRDELRKPAS
ncbi:MAG: sigma 54-interacting transcriptional regulator [Terriglobia bacterium]